MLCSYKVPFSTYLLPQHLNFYFHSYHCTCIRINILRLTIGLFFERRVVWWLNYHNWMHEKLSSDNSAIMIIQTGELHFLRWASDDRWVKYYASSVLKIRTIRHARRLSKLAWSCKWLQNADVVDKIIWNYFFYMAAIWFPSGRKGYIVVNCYQLSIFGGSYAENCAICS